MWVSSFMKSRLAHYLSSFVWRRNLLQDARSIDEVVVTMDGGPYQEYFYIEIPSQGTLKRFVYVHEVDSPRFPMQFGVEVSERL